MSRLKIFDACRTKNIKLEKFLSDKDESQDIISSGMTHKLVKFEKKINKLNKNSGLILLKTSINGVNHSIILVKHQDFRKGFSFFDANGHVNYGTFYIGDERGTPEYLDEVSPSYTLNGDVPENINPGYCGIFGIIFMVYFRNTNHIQKWNNYWIKFLNVIGAPSQYATNRDTKALILAAATQAIIANNFNETIMENKILELIKDTFFKEGVNFPQVSKKRQRTDFGKRKHFYNGRMYIIRVGPRGGKYILVNNIKKYIK